MTLDKLRATVSVQPVRDASALACKPQPYSSRDLPTGVTHRYCVSTKLQDIGPVLRTCHVGIFIRKNRALVLCEVSSRLADAEELQLQDRSPQLSISDSAIRLQLAGITGNAVGPTGQS